MRSEIDHFKKPHEIKQEPNKQLEQNEFEHQREIYLRAQQLGRVTRELLGVTGYYIDGKGGRGVPYTMIGDPVDVGESSGETVENGFHEYIRAYVAFDTTEHKGTKRSRFLRRASYSYLPDYGNVNKLGVIYLLGHANGGAGELAHVRSAHWFKDDHASVTDVDIIEHGLEVIQNALGGMVVLQGREAS